MKLPIFLISLGVFLMVLAAVSPSPAASTQAPGPVGYTASCAMCAPAP